MKNRIGGALVVAGVLAVGGLIALMAPGNAQGQSRAWQCYNLSVSDQGKAASSASLYTSKLNSMAPNPSSGQMIQISPYQILGGGAVEGTSGRIEVPNFLCIAQ
jgi:hypothetical protein